MSENVYVGRRRMLPRRSRAWSMKMAEQDVNPRSLFMGMNNHWQDRPRNNPEQISNTSKAPIVVGDKSQIQTAMGSCVQQETVAEQNCRVNGYQLRPSDDNKTNAAGATQPRADGGTQATVRVEKTKAIVSGVRIIKALRWTTIDKRQHTSTLTKEPTEGDNTKEYDLKSQAEPLKRSQVKDTPTVCCNSQHPENEKDDPRSSSPAGEQWHPLSSCNDKDKTGALNSETVNEGHTTNHTTKMSANQLSNSRIDVNDSQSENSTNKDSVTSRGNKPPYNREPLTVRAARGRVPTKHRYCSVNVSWHQLAKDRN